MIVAVCVWSEAVAIAPCRYPAESRRPATRCARSEVSVPFRTATVTVDGLDEAALPLEWPVAGALVAAAEPLDGDLLPPLEEVTITSAAITPTTTSALISNTKARGVLAPRGVAWRGGPRGGRPPAVAADGLLGGRGGICVD